MTESENNTGTKMNPYWTYRVLPLISAMAGAAVLWAAWFFFGDSFGESGVRWYYWITPVLLALGGLLCLAASPLLLMRKSAGRDLLKAAVGIIPLILAIRLLIVVTLFVDMVIRRIFDGTLFDFVGELDYNPFKIAINVAVVAAIILFVVIGKAAKSKQTPKGKEDER